MAVRPLRASTRVLSTTRRSTPSRSPRRPRCTTRWPSAPSTPASTSSSRSRWRSNVAGREELCALAERLDRPADGRSPAAVPPGVPQAEGPRARGALGRLQYLYSNRLNLGKIRREEDILWSFAPHDISMILSLVGQEPDTVTASGGYYLHKTIADVTTTHLAFRRRRAGARLRVVAAPVQGAEAGRGRRPTRWRCSTTASRGTRSSCSIRTGSTGARALPVPVKAEARAGRRSKQASRCGSSARTSSTASRRARRRAPTAREGLRVLQVLTRARRHAEARAEPAAAERARPRRRGGLPGVTIHESAYVDEPCRDRRGHADLALQPRPAAHAGSARTASSARTSWSART